MSAHSGNRRQSREAALGFLYQCDLKVNSRTETPPSFIQHFQLGEAFRPFFQTIVSGVQDHQGSIDLEIEAAAENWKLYRIGKIDLAILRIASFELFHCRETSHQIIIDEAVELAKDYGSQDSASFVNGVLDRIAHKSRPEMFDLAARHLSAS